MERIAKLFDAYLRTNGIGAARQLIAKRGGSGADYESVPLENISAFARDLGLTIADHAELTDAIPICRKASTPTIRNSRACTIRHGASSTADGAAMRSRAVYKTYEWVTRVEALKILQVRDSEFTEMVQRPDFPRPGISNSGVPRWNSEEILAWAENQKFRKRFSAR
jgi:hypothetical protein